MQLPLRVRLSRFPQLALGRPSPKASPRNPTEKQHDERVGESDREGETTALSPVGYFMVVLICAGRITEE